MLCSEFAKNAAKNYTDLRSRAPIDMIGGMDRDDQGSALRCERVPSVLGNARDDSKSIFTARLDHGRFAFCEIRCAGDRSKRIAMARDRDVDAAWRGPR